MSHRAPLRQFLRSLFRLVLHGQVRLLFSAAIYMSITLSSSLRHLTGRTSSPPNTLLIVLRNLLLPGYTFAGGCHTQPQAAWHMEITLDSPICSSLSHLGTIINLVDTLNSFSTQVPALSASVRTAVLSLVTVVRGFPDVHLLLALPCLCGHPPKANYGC